MTRLNRPRSKPLVPYRESWASYSARSRQKALTIALALKKVNRGQRGDAGLLEAFGDPSFIDREAVQAALDVNEAISRMIRICREKGKA